MRERPPASPYESEEEFRLVRDLLDAVGGLAWIQRIEAWDHTTITVTGDHGMTEVHTQVRPNVWLVEARSARSASGNRRGNSAS